MLSYKYYPRAILGALAGFVLTLVGCVPAVNTVYLAPERYPARPADHPIVLYSNKAPECPYEEIGIVTSRQRNKFISMQEVTESLRQEARKMGGDAVIGLTLSEQHMGAVVTGSSIAVDHDPVLKGTVIRWTKKDCRE